jgi:hypothetical protein
VRAKRVFSARGVGEDLSAIMDVVGNAVERLNPDANVVLERGLEGSEEAGADGRLEECDRNLRAGQYGMN